MLWLGLTDGGEAEPPANVFQKLVEGTTNYAQFMLDQDGTIIEWFGGAQRLYGYTPEEALGERLTLLLAENSGPPPLESLLPGEGGEPVEESGCHNRADGSVFWASFTVSRLSNGTFDGYAVISHDTTAKKQYERMLERQNDRLKEFTDILSHDLKSPLAVMSGRLSLYEQTGEQEHLETLRDTTLRMGNLVDDRSAHPVSTQNSVIFSSST